MSEITHEQPTPWTYFKVLIALMVLLALTVGLAFITLDRYLPGPFWTTGVALGIALAKGLFIVMVFMHVRFGSKLSAVFSGAGFLWLGILLVLTLSDYLTRNRPPKLNYKGEPRFLESMKADDRP